MEFQNSDLFPNSQNMSDAKKAAEVYRAKLGILNRYKYLNVNIIKKIMYSFQKVGKDNNESKKSKAEESEDVNRNTTSLRKEDRLDTIESDQESFPKIRERSNTLDSKLSGSIFQQK